MSGAANALPFQTDENSWVKSDPDQRWQIDKNQIYCSCAHFHKIMNGNRHTSNTTSVCN